MTTPVNEKGDPLARPMGESRDSDEGTAIGDDPNHLSVNTGIRNDYRMNSPTRPSPSQSREQASRLDDDLAMLQIERVVSSTSASKSDGEHSMHRSRSRPAAEPIDDFDAATNPLHETAMMYSPPENPTTSFAKFFKRIHNSSFLIRYFTYIVPVVALLLIPLLLGALVFPKANVGGVKLLWFSVWLEIVWLTLWAGRVS